MERIGDVAYRLALPLQISSVHDVFHVLMLRRYESDPSHILEWNRLELEVNVSFEEKPMEKLDRRDQVLRGKTIHLVKVLWNHNGIK